jgi:tryptophanyl-tRNA synthetase
MRAETDSGKNISFDTEKRPAISNLMTIYHHATGKTLKEIETEFEGKGYGDFKKALADALITMLEPVQKQLKEYKDDPGELSKILDKGAEAARAAAEKKMKVVRDKMGFGRA